MLQTHYTPFFQQASDKPTSTHTQNAGKETEDKHIFILHIMEDELANGHIKTSHLM